MPEREGMKMGNFMARCYDAVPWVREEAERHGLRLIVAYSRHFKSHTAHWMVETPEGERILNYWPTTGTFIIQRTGEKGTLKNWNNVVQLALKSASPARTPEFLPQEVTRFFFGVGIKTCKECLMRRVG